MDELLLSVKNYLGITLVDEDIDKNIKLKIVAVTKYLKRAGANISEDYKLDENIVSCIAIGVNDLLNSKAGETKFSPAFELLAMQICCGG